VSLELAAIGATFAPASLEELDARAPLEIRTDQKYVVDLDVLERAAARLEGAYVALEIGGRRTFVYDSVYFDTPAFATYHQHLQGRRKRFKCRTRLYADAGRCFVEVKLRDGRDRTVKRKLEIPHALHGALTGEAREFVDGELRRAYGYAAPDALAPTLGTAFSRLTLLACEGSERVTCDIGVAFTRASGEAWGIQPGKVLVETKTLAGNGAADRVLRALGARPVGSCSKYCLGIALAHAELRRNRFARVLREHFVATPVRPPLAA
jgi:hypothetical protein